MNCVDDGFSCRFIQTINIFCIAVVIIRFCPLVSNLISRSANVTCYELVLKLFVKLLSLPWNNDWFDTYEIFIKFNNFKKLFCLLLLLNVFRYSSVLHWILSIHLDAIVYVCEKLDSWTFIFWTLSWLDFCRVTAPLHQLKLYFTQLISLPIQ